MAIGTDDALSDGGEVLDVAGKHIRPALIDAQAHFRDPGLIHKEEFATGSTAATCGGITTIVDMPNVIPPTENAGQVQAKKKIAESKSLYDSGILGVVHQSSIDDILPMPKAGAVGYKIFFGETVGNLRIATTASASRFSRMTESGTPLSVHAENRQIQQYWTGRMQTPILNGGMVPVSGATVETPGVISSLTRPTWSACGDLVGFLAAMSFRGRRSRSSNSRGEIHLSLTTGPTNVAARRLLTFLCA